MEQDLKNDNKQSELHLCMNKIIDYLSRRDHSEKELREKLSQKKFSSEIIAQSITWAKERHYLRPPEELTKILTDILLRRGKGRNYIYQYLKKRGLPPPILEEIDKETELRKALEFAQQKIKPGIALDRMAREKIGRKLITRGFSLDVVRTVIYEKLQQ